MRLGRPRKWPLANCSTVISELVRRLPETPIAVHHNQHVRPEPRRRPPPPGPCVDPNTILWGDPATSGRLGLALYGDAGCRSARWPRWQETAFEVKDKWHDGAGRIPVSRAMDTAAKALKVVEGALDGLLLTAGDVPLRITTPRS